MSQLMIVSMLIFFGLSVPVAVSIGLASLAGSAPPTCPGWWWPSSYTPRWTSTRWWRFLLHPGRQPDGSRRHFRTHGRVRQEPVGGIQGGLACTCVLTCMIFAAVAGSSVATTFAVGAILIPAMIRHGYPAPFAASLQASAAELG